MAGWMNNGAGLLWIGGIPVLLFLVLGVIVLVQGTKLNRLQKRNRLLMDGKDPDNLADLVLHMQEKLRILEGDLQETRKELKITQEQLHRTKGRVGLLRYNPFGDRGSDQSFSLAVLDGAENGYVLTALHSREQTYLYAKPLQNGQSSYALSPEEKEAILAAAAHQSGIV